MKQTKTRAAKRPAKRSFNSGQRNPILGKLLDLKYRLNDTYNDENNTMCVDTLKGDKSYVMSLISDIRKNGFTKLAPEDGHCCNGLWRKYEGK